MTRSRGRDAASEAEKWVQAGQVGWNLGKGKAVTRLGASGKEGDVFVQGTGVYFPLGNALAE